MIRNRADLNTYFALMSQNKPRMKAFSLHKESPSDVLFIIFNNFQPQNPVEKEANFLNVKAKLLETVRFKQIY